MKFYDKWWGNSYVLLVRSNPKTFHYNSDKVIVAITQQVSDNTVNYYDKYKDIVNSRIYISTLDDVSMNLWLKQQLSKSQVWLLLNRYQNKKTIIQDVYTEFEIIKELLQLDNSDFSNIDFD